MDHTPLLLSQNTPQPTLRACLRNPNIALALLFRASDAAAQGVWNYATLTALLYLLTHGTQASGILQGVQGLATILVALPAGWAADRGRRDRLLRYHAAAGLLAVAALTVGLLAPSVMLLGVVRSQPLLLCCAMWLFGCCYAGNPLIEAIVADSTPTGVSFFVGGSFLSVVFLFRLLFTPPLCLSINAVSP